MPEARHNLPLDSLRGFEAAARHLNFTRAAEELFITQSAMSRQIKSLETMLGVTLFARGPRGLTMTIEAERLYRAVSGALAQVREAIEQITGGASSPVTVSCTLAFCSLWLIPRLASFQSAFPGVEVRLSANNHIIHLERERIDLAIRFCSEQAAPEGAVYLFGEKVLPVCAPALAKDRTRPLRQVSDLAHHVLLHLDEPLGPLPWLSWPTWLEAAGAPRLRPAGSLHFNHYEQVVRAALGGQGIALGRMPLVANLLENGSLVPLFPQASTVNRAYWLVQSPLAHGRAEVTWFVEWLRAEAARDQEAAIETSKQHGIVTAKPRSSARSRRT
jgi:DNA-binding transcriptional LysR family regulator